MSSAGKATFRIVEHSWMFWQPTSTETVRLPLRTNTNEHHTCEKCTVTVNQLVDYLENRFASWPDKIQFHIPVDIHTVHSSWTEWTGYIHMWIQSMASMQLWLQVEEIAPWKVFLHQIYQQEHQWQHRRSASPSTQPTSQQGIKQEHSLRICL